MRTTKERERDRQKRATAAVVRMAKERAMYKQSLASRVMLWFDGLPKDAQAVILGQVTLGGELVALGRLLETARAAQGLTADAELADVERHNEAMLVEIVALDGIEQARTGWRLREMLTEPEGG